MKFAFRFAHRFLLAASLALAPVSASLAVPTFAFSSPSGALHPAGSLFSVDVVGSALSDLYAYQFSVVFNPSLLRVLGVTEGPFLQAGGSTFFDGGTIDNASGTVSFTFDTLISAVPGVSGSGVLAHIDLAALASGSGSLSLTDVIALDSLLNDLVVTVRPIALAVPEPGTIALILLAGGLGIASRRRRAHSSREGRQLPFAGA